MSERLRVVPLTLAEANAMVLTLHRHHKPATGHRFSLGVVDAKGQLRGVAIVGRPVARALDARMVCEVSRVATDGARNACSALLGAAARAARAMGFAKIQTYTLPSEGGASLRGAGWVCEGAAGGGQWVRSDGALRCTDQPTEIKTRWAKYLNPVASCVLPEPEPVDYGQLGLFGSGHE